MVMEHLANPPVYRRAAVRDGAASHPRRAPPPAGPNAHPPARARTESPTPGSEAATNSAAKMQTHEDRSEESVERLASPVSLIQEEDWQPQQLTGGRRVRPSPCFCRWQCLRHKLKGGAEQSRARKGQVQWGGGSGRVYKRARGFLSDRAGLGLSARL